MDDLERLADLLEQMNRVGNEIAQRIQRPALTGHLGEFIASRIFRIDLEASATSRSKDEHFRDGPLAGRSANVKCYPKIETLDIRPQGGWRGCSSGRQTWKRFSTRRPG